MFSGVAYSLLQRQGGPRRRTGPEGLCCSFRLHSRVHEVGSSQLQHPLLAAIRILQPSPRSPLARASLSCHVSIAARSRCRDARAALTLAAEGQGYRPANLVEVTTAAQVPFQVTLPSSSPETVSISIRRLAALPLWLSLSLALTLPLSFSTATEHRLAKKSRCFLLACCSSR